MRIRTALAILSAVAVSAVASAQSALPPALHVGDKAPGLPIAGVVKGEKPGNVKGKTYVVEFWATWCGPCIASMPHLSDMADKYKGKVNFYSVNTWDFNGKTPGAKEEVADHNKRVEEWVTKNTDKMRYNIVLDDQKDTISTNWMFAAGRYGIPCAFIVNEEGTIAWVGHPMQMEEPLEKISSKTWDLEAFKAKINPTIDSERTKREVQLKVAAAAKAGDAATLDAIIQAGKGDKFAEISSVIASSARSNPKLAVDFLKKYYGTAGTDKTMEWASLIMAVSSSVKEDADKADLAKISEKNANTADPKIAAVVYAYHARVLNAAGQKDNAMAWIDKAKNAVDTFEPAQQKDSVAKYIESTAKSFKQQ